MLLSPLLFLLAAADTPSTIVLAPAPGAPPAVSIGLSDRAVALDADGRGSVPAAIGLWAPEWRFYRGRTPGSKEEIAFYYPSDHTLVTWRFASQELSGGAEVVVKDHEAGSWKESATLAAFLERDERSSKVRFALAPGLWDLAVLVPGYGPAFTSDVHVKGATQFLGKSKLARAAHLKGRILDSVSGRPPASWSAHVRRASLDLESNEARFFDERPIAVDKETLDFASLRPGDWSLLVNAPGRTRQERSVKAPGPGLIELGDVFLSQSGSVRVTLAFPAEIPRGEFIVRLKSVPENGEEAPVELDSETVRPRSETLIVFDDVEEELVSLECEDRSKAIRHHERIHVEAGQATEVRIDFYPLTLQGRVTRGDHPVSDALVRAAVAQLPERDLSATTDDSGRYSLRFWTTQERIFLSTIAPGEGLPVSEEIPVEPGTTELEHDVILPAGEIRGIVRDAETGEALKGAKVRYSASLSESQEKDVQEDFAMGNETDREGRFRLESLPLKPVEVEVKREGYSPAVFPKVQPTPEGAELDVRLEKGFRLVGTVLDEKGAPVAGVAVGIDPDRLNIYFTRTASTSATGEFEFGSIGHGPHVLGIFACGYTLVLRTITVEPSRSGEREQTVEIRLAPAPAPIPVRFEDENGAPFERVAVQWMLDGLILPLSDFSRADNACDAASSPDADGNQMLRGFPYGTISALTMPPEQRPLGTYTNDGSQARWTIRVPRFLKPNQPGNNP